MFINANTQQMVMINHLDLHKAKPLLSLLMALVMTLEESRLTLGESRSKLNPPTSQ